MRTARTSLLYKLLQLLAECDQPFAEKHFKGISRRKFLATSTAAATAGTLISGMSSCGGDSSHFLVDAEHHEVVIIGAGIAGLNCARQLQKAGISFKVFEASRRNGGRILTHYNDSLGNGVFPEFGGDFIDSNHSEMLALAKEFQLPLIDLSEERSTQNLKGDIFFFEGKEKTEKQMLQAFRQMVPQLQKDIAAIGENYDTPEALDLDNTPLSDYIASLDTPQWMKDLLNAAYNAEYGLDTAEQSTLNMLCMIEPDTENGVRVFGDSDERFRIEGGNSKLIEALVKAVGKENIQQFAKLTELSGDSNKGYYLRFENGMEITADYVVLAIPFTMLREVKLELPEMTAVKKKCIDELGYGQNTKLILPYSSRPWRSLHRAQGYLFHTIITNGWDGSYNGNGTSGAYVCFFGGSFAQALNQQSSLTPGAPKWHSWKTHLPQSVIDEMSDHIDQVFPGAKTQQLPQHVFVNWIDYPLMKGSYSCYKPGQWQSISGWEAAPVGRVLFAGEHCSADFQGFMNGAAESGKETGVALLELLKNNAEKAT